MELDNGRGNEDEIETESETDNEDENETESDTENEMETEPLKSEGGPSVGNLSTTQKRCSDEKFLSYSKEVASGSKSGYSKQK